MKNKLSRTLAVFAAFVLLSATVAIEAEASDYESENQTSLNEQEVVVGPVTKCEEVGYNLNEDSGITDESIAITITPNSDTVIYDGESHSVDGITVNGVNATKLENGSYNFTYNGSTYNIEGISASKTAVKAGEYNVTVRGNKPVIRDAEGHDVTGQFDITKGTGKLLIKKRAVIITSASDFKVYDGTALKRSDVYDDIVADGFVGTDGERVKYSFDSTASQTEVGIAENSFTYIIPGAVVDNYDITLVFGTLEVMPVGGVSGDEPGDTPGNTSVTPTDNPGGASGTDTVVSTEVITNSLSQKMNKTQGSVMATNAIAEDEILQIADEDVPLAHTGDLRHWAFVNLVALILTALLSLCLIMGVFRKLENEEEGQVSRHPFIRIASIIPAIVGVLVFIATEDMGNSMILADEWTLLMIAILASQLSVTYFAKRKKKKDEDDMVMA